MKSKKLKRDTENNFIKIFFFLIVSVSYFPSSAFSAPPAIKRLTVTLPGGEKIDAAVADSNESRNLGLMGRFHLDSNEGMIFLFDKNEFHMMWMKNMLIPLDIVWINEKKEIIDIIPSIPPCREDPCPIYGPSSPSRYVLELSAGTSSLFHLVNGMRLKFP